MPVGPSAGDVSRKFHLSMGAAPDPKQRFFFKKGKLFNVHKEVNYSKLRHCHKTPFELYLSMWLIFKEIENTKRNKRREENQLDATEYFIALIICSTCFGHLYAHHQELETILALLPHMVCNALVAGGRLLGAEQQAIRSG